MTVSVQTNTTLGEIADTLRERDNFVICGHTSPDGDCVGSALALAHSLQLLDKHASCVYARDASLDANLLFMPGTNDIVPAAEYEGPCDVFVAVDVSARERLADGERLLQAAPLSVTIDHHESDRAITDLFYAEPDCPSTTMLIWRLAHMLGTDCDIDVATCAYTGLVTDTGRFQFQNVNAQAFHAAAEMMEAGVNCAEVAKAISQNRSRASVLLERAVIDHMVFSPDGSVVLSWLSLDDFEACGAVRADSEPMVNLLRSMAGVSVACMLREQEGEIRGSLRAKDDTDVASLAREFGGGGHAAAAGFTLQGSLRDALITLTHRLGISSNGGLC